MDYVTSRNLTKYMHELKAIYMVSGRENAFAARAPTPRHRELRKLLGG